jgi:hypothetical protein
MAAHKGNQYHLKYTLPIALKLFEKAKDLLIASPDIITETELIFKCKYELLLPYRSYRYLADEKFPKDLADIRGEIESILEARVMKSKEMYPGIAAMTLKNKHGWKDQQDIKQTTEVTIKTASDKLKKRIQDNIK